MDWYIGLLKNQRKLNTITWEENLSAHSFFVSHEIFLQEAIDKN